MVIFRCVIVFNKVITGLIYLNIIFCYLACNNEKYGLSVVKKCIRYNTWDFKIVPLRILVKTKTYIVISYFCVPYGKSREVL